MEEHSVVKKRSVAELAGKFSCPVSHMTDAEVNKPVRRRPPRSLPLPAGNDASQGQDEKGTETVSTRKNRNSALIEKLQASLTLSPTGPGVMKLPVQAFSPGSPSSPSSPTATVTPKEEETPASFESTAEGTVLKSINKGRARHSIKRRPPSRRHRKSSADEGGEEVDKTPTLDRTTPNGHEGDVFEGHKTSPDAESLSSKEQIEQETKATDSEKPEPEEIVETVTSEKEDGEEKTKPEDEEEKTKLDDKEEKTKPEDKEEKTKPEDKEEQTKPEDEEEKKTEDKEEKTEPENKEEESEDEPQLAYSTEETREEPVTPQTEANTTDEKEEEQKEDEVNH
ncbi:duboraya isoform X2 [Carassius carassius]|uniref:duboraya isoform X2 n=1 Tax=Carassius carassius TaxID=217509 RepID=UPI0028687164|nr:duboraya isoform X2 [Carassius carassius]